MKIAILGTRGIPNHYGGFEQVSEYLSVGLAARGHEVSVYCSHNHLYKNSTWNGINLIHCYDGERLLNTAGQFIYDLNCIRDAGKRKFDVLLFMGYTSSSVWAKWFPKNTLVISNMDGLEWKRKKYSRPVQLFLKHAEKLAVKNSHYHIADSIGIKQHLDKSYGIDCCYIPYGAAIMLAKENAIPEELNVVKGNYNMLMARMEPENNIETILEGFCLSRTNKKMLVIGNVQNNYGKKILSRFSNNQNIVFAGALFEKEKLNALRSACHIYFHGHSVGGTNPSLLEAMSSGALIAAHNNPFNKSILGDDALYFNDSSDVSTHMLQVEKTTYQDKINNNLKKIKEVYCWENIIEKYDRYIRLSFKQFHK
jgi:glycosyltransferase involved in cell wall biosynthesis